MSWHYLQGAAAESWAGSCLDGAPFALLKLIPIADRSCSHVNETETSPGSPYGMTCGRLTGARGAAASTLLVGDFPAKISARPEMDGGSRASGADYGQKWRASFARYDPVLCSWKTAQFSLLGDSDVYSETWPRWGSMRNGACSERGIPVRRTGGIGFGSWLPTPTVSTHWSNRSMSDGAAVRLTLCGMAAKNTWPTPTAHNAKETNAPSESKRNTPTLAAQVGGHLNPTWVEWLMGWPIGWTDCEPLATDRFRRWRRLHGPR